MVPVPATERMHAADAYSALDIKIRSELHRYQKPIDPSGALQHPTHLIDQALGDAVAPVPLRTLPAVAPQRGAAGSRRTKRAPCCLSGPALDFFVDERS